MECSDGVCGLKAYKDGLCVKHFGVWNKGQTCTVQGCESFRRGRSEYCERHYRADLAEKNKTVRPCRYPGCVHPSVAKGLCDNHRCRLDRYGTLEPQRPSDWGLREQHPLIQTYRHITRRTKEGVTREWEDFWSFIADVGEERPEGHTLRRYDKSKPFGPGNFYWKKRQSSEDKAAYMREYSRRNPERAKSATLKKNFGITLDDYNEMLEAQGGVCAICGGEESGRYQYLAVDHDHQTKKIRGLLCHKCNKGIGCLKDSVDVLQSAIRYLTANGPERR